MATVIMTHKPGLNNISEIFKSTNEQTIINVTRAKFIQGNNLMDITPYGRRAIKVPEFNPNGGIMLSLGMYTITGD